MCKPQEANIYQRASGHLDDVLGAVVAAVRLGLPRVALRQTPRALPPRHRPLLTHLPPRPTLLFVPSILASKNRKMSQIRQITEQGTATDKSSDQDNAGDGMEKTRSPIGVASYPLAPAPSALRASIPGRDDGCFPGSPTQLNCSSRRGDGSRRNQMGCILSSPLCPNKFGPLGVTAIKLPVRT
jgi:hypothetical protein